MHWVKRLGRKYNRMSNFQILILSIILSLILSIMVVNKSQFGGVAEEGREALVRFFPLLVLNLTPAMTMLKIGSLKKIKEKPRYAIYLILYFLFFIPIFLGIESFGEGEIIKKNSFLFIFIGSMNFLAILASHIILIRYIFLDIMLKRRKPRGKDTILLFMTYITLGISFGFFHALVSLYSKTQAYTNMSLDLIDQLGSVKFYFRHIYYSFITLTSVGYGDISPLTWIAQFTTVIESLVGVFLLSFSLGIILSTEAETDTIKEDDEQRFKKELLDDIEKLLDRKLREGNLSNSEKSEVEEIIVRKESVIKPKKRYLRKIKKIFRKK